MNCEYWNTRTSFSVVSQEKSGWVVQVVEVITADHDRVIKSNLVSTVTFDIDIPNNPNLGSFFQWK